MAEIEDGIDSDRLILRNKLRLYIREAWHVIEAATVYLENWHIDLIAEHLEAVTAGQIECLLISHIGPSVSEIPRDCLFGFAP